MSGNYEIVNVELKLASSENNQAHFLLKVKNKAKISLKGKWAIKKSSKKQFLANFPA